jgi:hypothetical protein
MSGVSMLDADYKTVKSTAQIIRYQHYMGEMELKRNWKLIPFHVHTQLLDKEQYEEK